MQKWALTAMQKKGSEVCECKWLKKDFSLTHKNISLSKKNFLALDYETIVASSLTLKFGRWKFLIKGYVF